MAAINSTMRLLAQAKRKQIDAYRPFDLPAFPPAAVPPKSVLAKYQRKQGMAMDDFPGASWASGFVGVPGFSEGQVFLGYPELAVLAQRAEYRRMVEIYAQEMTRKGFEWVAKSDKAGKKKDKNEKISKMKDWCAALNVDMTLRALVEGDGFFGRHHLYLDTGDVNDRNEMTMPIGNGWDEWSKKKITPKHPILRFATVEAVWVYPLRYNTSDPLAPDWYKPSTWWALAREVHASRLIPYIGREVPDLLKSSYAFGGLSLSQMAKPYVDNWLNTRQSVADLIQAFSVMVLATDLAAALQAGGSELFERAELFNWMRDNRGLMLTNKDSEELTNVSAPLGGLHELQAQTQEHMASVDGFPFMKIFGFQPSGLNADSDAILRSFYDSVAARQEKTLTPVVHALNGFCQLSLFGELDPDIVHKWTPLWSLTEKEEAEVRKTDAETDSILIADGILHPEEVRERIANDEDSPYPEIDIEDLPELPEEQGPEINVATGRVKEEKPLGRAA